MLSSTSKTRSGRLPVQYNGNVFHFRDIDVFPPKKGGGKRKGGVGKKEKNSGNWEEMTIMAMECECVKVSSYSHCIIESASHGPFLWNSYARMMKDYVG
ncbi:hypothetical protein MKW92_034829 [Papaver armeniacum]|nr:hypothetical protein MKW92_034829 [Papaver armeniacum]